MIWRYLILTAILVLSGVAAMAQGSGVSLNMTLFDHFSGPDWVTPHSALWGYLGPDGREYAIVGSQRGTYIVDVTEKPVRQVAYIWGPTSVWREMKVYKNYAYIVTESRDSGRGLQIVDLSGLPASANLARTDTSLFLSAHTIFIRDHFMYVMGTGADAGANGGVIIFDLEPDPLHPKRIGMVGPYYYHDAWERNDTLVCAAINGQGCDLYDVRDKANPQHLVTITYPYSGTHNAEITSDGGYVVTTDEVGFTAKTMKVWDIHDLNNITKVAEYTPNPVDIVHNVHIRGRYALVAWYTAGVRIIDMIDPTHPREVGYYDTYPGASDGYNGVWESYGIFPSGKVIAGDRQTGLYVLEFNMATAGSLSGVVRNATTGDPLPGAVVRVPETGATVVADASGAYYVGAANGARITLTTREFGYAGTAEPETLAGDAHHDILLTPLELLSATLNVHDRGGAPVTEFAYALEPYLHSTTASGAKATLLLPRDSSFVLTVAKWGYGIERVPVRITGNNQTIDVTLRKHYQDDATLNLGWTYHSPDDDATGGRWVRMVPYTAFPGSSWIYPGTQAAGDTGFVFQTGAPQFNAPPQTSDVNGGTTTLTSPAMDLTEYNSPRIDYDLWFVHYLADKALDTLLVQVSNDDGASWLTAYSETEGRSGWKHHSFNIGDVAPLSAHMRMRIRARDTLSTALVYVALDNFEVSGGGEPAGVPVAGGAVRPALLAMAAQPNPIRATGTLTLDAAAAFGYLRVEIYNSLGQRAALVFEGAMAAGEHSFTVGAGLPSGNYRVLASDRDGHSWSGGLVVAK